MDRGETLKEAVARAGLPIPEGTELYYGWRHHGGKSLLAMDKPCGVDQHAFELQMVGMTPIWQECSPMEGLLVSNLPLSDSGDLIAIIFAKNPQVVGTQSEVGEAP